MTSSDESACSSCFPPWHSHWLRVKEKTCIHLPLLLSCTYQTHFSSQTPYYCIKIITDQSIFMDEARNAFLTLNRLHWVAFYFSELLSEFSLRCVSSTPIYITSKCMNKGISITSGVMFLTCPIKNIGPR